MLKKRNINNNNNNNNNNTSSFNNKRRKLQQNWFFIDFPKEIILEIFCFFKKDFQGLKSLRLCCKDFYNIITNEFWDQKIPLSNLTQFISSRQSLPHCPSVTLVLNDISKGNQTFSIPDFTNFENLPLKSLTIYESQQTTRVIKTIIDKICEHFPITVKVLYLTGHCVFKLSKILVEHLLKHPNVIIGIFFTKYDDLTTLQHFHINYKYESKYLDIFNFMIISPKLQQQGSEIDDLKQHFNSFIIHGHSINQKNAFQHHSTPLFTFMHEFNFISEYCKRPLCEVVEIFLQNGALVNIQNDFNSTPLHEVCKLKKNSIDTVRLLLQHGAQLLYDNKGNTPIHVAFKYQNFGIVGLLNNSKNQKEGEEEKQNIDLINQPNEFGKTPIMLAIESQQIDCETILQFLVKNVVNLKKHIHHKDGFGWNLLHYVVYYTPSLGLIKFLFQNGFNDINQQTSKKETPLYLCCKRVHQDSQYKDIMNFLLSNGAQTDFYTSNDEFDCCLNQLYHNNCGFELFLLFFKFGASVNQKLGPDGKTLLALHLQNDPKESFNEITTYLIENGTDINIQDRYGYTPLYDAICAKPPKIKQIEVLLKHGAKINLQIQSGETPLDLLLSARYSSKFTVIDLLKSHGAKQSKDL